MITKPTDRARSREPLTKPREVTCFFGPEAGTDIDWAKADKLTSPRALGGRHRFHPAVVVELLKLSKTGSPGGRTYSNSDTCEEVSG
ncbi:MerR family DNA-binding transcriptional regulator (plasmid) [Streptosporangium sp. NBC_01495]|uniref:MerR family DNA-binding transcriptional regulator n=1 Tax=Streptosporangium sp. NBC_01495 TaxID=2903899 RepID=UPI002E2EA46E|nr:MerR family DNA-binding transcriptional regulator [Streptosporangium sp. NBC_01495]